MWVRKGGLFRLLFVGSITSFGAAAKCELPCQNKGKCQLPTAEGGSPTCQCRTGFVGALCEIQYVLCDNSDQVCPNGNACQRSVGDMGDEFFHCACDMQKSDLSMPYAAKFCEHESTVFCRTADDEELAKEDRHSLGGTAGGSFCVNGGSCKQDVEEGHHHPGCECPDGYSGQHCEKPDHPVEVTESSTILFYPKKRSVWATIATFLLFFLVFMTVGAAGLVWYANRKRTPNKRVKAEEKKSKQSAEERARIPAYPGADDPVLA